MGVPKRLFFDIETSFCIFWGWRTGYNINISASNILHHAKIICIGYKWEGERKVHCIEWDKSQGDRGMLREFIKVANEADEIIFHNGDKFDLPWVRTRCLLHGIDMFPDYRTTDTVKIARSKFNFPDNKLKTIAEYLGLQTKKRTTEDLWKNIVLDKSESAMVKMKAYCKQDVKVLESVYKELSKHITSKVHHGVLMGHDRGSCPHCGGLDLVKRRIVATQTGLLKRVFSCNGCNRYHTKTVKER